MSKLKQFQRKNGLTPDGIIGRFTLLKMMVVFNIKTKEATAHFVGQLAHETNNFKARTESFNYSVNGLAKTFSFYRKNPELARLHGRRTGRKANQMLIENNVYDDNNRSKRYKLGNVCPGDGWKFRGRGSIMVTGRNNYEAFFCWLGIPKDSDPSLVATTYYWECALWFFEVNKLWRLALNVSDYSITKLTEKINGGLNGFDHRKELTELFLRLLR